MSFPALDLSESKAFAMVVCDEQSNVLSAFCQGKFHPHMQCYGAITQTIGAADQYPHQCFSKESVQRAIQFKPRPSDVFILTAPKSGTTYLQQICHQIRTGGHMDFEDIYQVVPWAQMGWDLDLDLNSDQISMPRLFKTHQRLSSINRGARYIVTIRRPEAVLISWFQFLKQHGAPPATNPKDVSEFLLTSTEYFRDGMRFGANIWEYYAEFYKCRDLQNVLVLVYEDLVKNPQIYVQAIAQFMGIPLCPEKTKLVCDMCTKDYMMKHGSKFDESWAYTKLKRVGRCPDPESFRPCLRVSKQGHGDKLNEAARNLMKSKWKESFSQFALPDYDAMAQDVRATIARKFCNLTIPGRSSTLVQT